MLLVTSPVRSSISSSGSVTSSSIQLSFMPSSSRGFIPEAAVLLPVAVVDTGGAAATLFPDAAGFTTLPPDSTVGCAASGTDTFVTAAPALSESGLPSASLLIASFAACFSTSAMSSLICSCKASSASSKSARSFSHSLLVKDCAPVWKVGSTFPSLTFFAISSIWARICSR